MKSVEININGKVIEAKEGQSVLSASLEAGIYIPHLCYHKDLSPVGACNLCLVEVQGEEEPCNSCELTVKEDMVIKTDSAKIKEMRKLALELMLSGHPSDCTGCPKYGNCELQALTQYLEVADGRLRKRTKLLAVNNRNPLFVHDSIRCIQCGRCIRVCKDVRGVGVLQFNMKNHEIYVGTKDDISLAEAGCRFCGACVEVCPTGTLRDKEGLINLEINRNSGLVPCRTACPAGTDVPRYVRYIKEGKYDEAVAVIREKSPFPLVLGHICNHVCEDHCRRKEVNSSISIKELKRYAAENSNNEIWREKSKIKAKTDKKVAIIGAGPAGLTSAYYLAKQGHNVTIYEAQPKAGGMLRYGIPEYRLPKDTLQKEIEIIKSVGIEIITNSKILNVNNLLDQGYDSVVVTIGTHQGIKLPIKGNELHGVLLNTDFLRDVALNKEVKLGKSVVVLGGGNVAFDCARVARRLGVDEVHLVCLESRENMMASIEEIEQGEEEGIKIYDGQSFVEITSVGNKVAGVKCLKVESFTFDENRKAVIKTVEGSEKIIGADNVIFAVGQRPESYSEFGLQTVRGSFIKVDDNLVTSNSNVFAAGDVIYGTKSVIEAIASGRKVATEVDKYLGGDGYIEEVLAPIEEPNNCIGRLESFALKEREIVDSMESNLRINSFCQVDSCLTNEKASNESDRCLQCDLRTKISVPKFWADYSKN